MPKQYSLSYWVKQALQYESKPEIIIGNAVAAFARDPATCPFTFNGTPLEAFNAAYTEWRKRCGSVHASLFPTPLAVADELAALAEVNASDIVFDPGAGLGNLLHAATKRGARAFGVETQYWIPPVADSLGLDIRRGDYLDGFNPDLFTCVLTNPPYGVLFDVPDATTAFLNRIADQANPNTKIAAIVPAGFMDSAKPKARAAAVSRFSVVSTKRLDETTFAPLTKIRTDMVLLQKN